MDIILENSLFQTLWLLVILLLIINISFNHILFCLASFDLYCGSFAVYRVEVFVASGAVFWTHFMDTAVFGYIDIWDFCKKKSSSIVLSKMMSNDLKYNMSAFRLSKTQCVCQLTRNCYNTYEVYLLHKFMSSNILLWPSIF